MKHHLSALKGSSVTGYQSLLSSEPSRVNMCRAGSVSGSFQEVRFSFLMQHRRLSPCNLRWMTSSFSSLFRQLRYGSVSQTRNKHVANLDYNPNISQQCTVRRCILDKIGRLQQVSVQVSEHNHLQLCTADLSSQTQVWPTVGWAELTC